jgi:hypothetical protein
MCVSGDSILRLLRSGSEPPVALGAAGSSSEPSAELPGRCEGVALGVGGLAVGRGTLAHQYVGSLHVVLPRLAVGRVARRG